MNNLPQTPQSNAADDEIDLFELAQSIWQERILVVIVTAAVTVLALIYALLVTPVYEASADLNVINLSASPALHDLPADFKAA